MSLFYRGVSGLQTAVFHLERHSVSNGIKATLHCKRQQQKKHTFYLNMKYSSELLEAFLDFDHLSSNIFDLFESKMKMNQSKYWQEKVTAIPILQMKNFLCLRTRELRLRSDGIYQHLVVQHTILLNVNIYNTVMLNPCDLRLIRILFGINY